MKTPIRIEVVAPVHNRRAITLQCLKSLSRIERDGIDVHTIIVDDGSTDGTGEAIRNSFPGVEVVEGNGNLWFTEGTNVGVRRALTYEPDFLLLMNDDQVFDERFLTFLVETALCHPRSIVGPLLLLWDTPHKIFQTAPVWDTWSGGWRHWHKQTIWTVPDRPWNVDLIVGNCLLVPAEAFRESGLMNSERYPNFGDAELTPRLKRQGWHLLIDPRSRVFCQPNTPPPRVRKMGLRKMFTDLFVDLGRNHNLRRRLYASLDGAPSRLLGLAAFAAFLFRAVTGRSSEREAWAANREEQPLKETFASAVVND